MTHLILRLTTPLLALLAVGPATAAPFLSEIYLPDPDAERPAAVEIDGLAGTASLSLAIVNARPDSLSNIEAVIEISGLDQSTLLLTASQWADSPWTVGPPPHQVVAPELNEFRPQTELLLFEGSTTLVPDTALRSTTDENPAKAYDANPAVDALAWASGGEDSATPFAAAHTLDTDRGDTIVRPVVNLSPRLDQPLIGTAEDNGTFHAWPYTYAVSPGLSNPSVAELIPEPTAALLVVFGCPLLLMRRPRVMRQPRAGARRSPGAARSPTSRRLTPRCSPRPERL